MSALIVIGFGNELRGDDGVGPRVARAVAALNRPDSHGLAVQQLTLELVSDLANVDRVVFVDARPVTHPTNDRRLIWQKLDTKDISMVLGHFCTPETLLAIAKGAYGHAPEAWLVTIPVRAFGFNEALTPSAQRHVQKVVRQIAAYADDQRSPLKAVRNA